MKDKLSISKNKAYHIASSGSLDTVRVGRALRINDESLTRWLESVKQKRRGGGEMG
jgi:excisionase family DNA binding protein